MKFIKSTLAVALLGIFTVSCSTHQSCAAYGSNQKIEKNSNETHASAELEENINF